MQQVFTDESLTRADRASRLISGRDVLFGASQTTKQYHADGYVKVLNQYGTQNDTTEQYEYSPEGSVMDIKLNQLYEGDGLFAKIIDTPADECVKQGFSFGNLSDEKVESFLRQSLDDLDWEDVFSTAVKWSRLFGGAIGVMLIDDGGELDEPLNWSSIKSIDEVRIYERAVVQPDYTSLYRINPQYDGGSRVQSKFGMPQYYTVMSQYGSFVVHESRCLVFRNGRLPERTSNPLYQIWGMPEYIRIKRAMRDATVAHGDATKLLERSVQAVYSMKGLADECSTEEGENRILKRLQTIDTSRGLMNTISIDADGENYDFKTFSFSGVSDVVDTSCNLLSALTNIPQTILFGRSPAGMSATGESDMENFYNFVERIQKTMLRPNLQVLLDVIIQAGVHAGELDKAPDIHLEFNPLWSLSEAEQAQVEATKAATASTRANTAIAYVNSQILDPTEVRRKLAESGEFNVEDIITEDDIDEDDILNAMNAPTQQSANPTVEGELANKPQQLQQQNQPPEQPDNQTSSKPKLLTKGHFSKYSDGESSRHSWDSVDADGGPGSGNFNHGGRPGEVGGSSPSLSDAEVKSIVRYTGTNEHLSDEDKDNIESAIKKSPPLDPELSYQRGLALKPSELKDFIEKGIYEPKDLTSWSNSESVAYNRCADLNWGDKVNVILSYNGKKQLDNGISVTEWSQNPDEDEIIFGSSAKMRIAKDEIYGIDEETGTADPESTVYINLYDDENTDSADFNSDYDKPAKDLDWITVNGTHTPIVEGKAASGGKLKGKDFSKSKTERSKSTSNGTAKASYLNSTMSAACKASKDGDKDKAYSLAEKFLSDVPVGSTIKMQSWNDECPELKKIDNNVYQNTLTGEKLDKDSALAQYDYSDTDDDSMRVAEVGSGSDDTAASSDLDRRLAWGKKISEEREKMSAAKPAKQAMMLNDAHFLSYDDAVKAMKDGTAGEKLNDYFDIMDENGDPTPTKPVSKQLLGFGSNVSEEYAGDWSNARLGYIEKYTGQSKEQAEKTKSELDTWFGGGWSKADTATLDKYIDEDHAYDGELYRGLHFENDGDFDSFIAQCEPGAVITNKNGMNSSWSSSEGMARNFAHFANKAVDSVVLHCVKNRTTSPVSYLSSKGEDECLSHSKAQWTVLRTDISETGQGGRKADVYVVEKGEYAE